MKKLRDKNIAVLAGGTSCEREISLLSGKAVYDALLSLGLKVTRIDPKENFLSQLDKDTIDLAFIALHGSFGEDGQVQTILDKMNIPYTGSGVLASRNSFDKSKTQSIFQENAIPVPAFHTFKKNARNSRPESFTAPFVIKPATCGSSVGVSIVSKDSDFDKALETAFLYSDTALLEQYIHGRELTVGILGDRALPIVEVTAKRKFYDYEAKYKANDTSYQVPAELTPEEARQIADLALKAHEVLGCEAMSRVDIILGDDKKPYVLEINTIPGLTGKSLLPKAAKALGIDFPGLCVKILELSLNKQRIQVPINGKTS